MKNLISLLICSFAISASGAVSYGPLMVDRTDLNAFPSGFMASNVLAGSGVTITPDGSGRVTVGAVVSAYTNGAILYVSTNGNDGTAVIGRQDLPWATPAVAISNAPNDSLVYIMPGQYNLAGVVADPLTGDDAYPIQARNKTNVVIEGVGAASYLKGTNAGGYIAAKYCENLIFKNLRLDGTKTTSYASTFGAISLKTNRNVIFSGLSLFHHGDNGIIGASANNTNVTVANCYFYNVGETNQLFPGPTHDGACVINLGAYTTVVGNTFQECFRAVELEGETDSFIGLTVAQNRMLDCFDWNVKVWLQGYTQASIDGFTHGMIIDNVFACTQEAIDEKVPSLTAHWGVNIQGGDGWTLSRNRFYNFGYVGIGISLGTNASRFIITENTFERIGLNGVNYSAQDGSEGLATDAIISHNTFQYVSNYNVQVNAQFVTISENHFLDWGTTTGAGSEYAIDLRNHGGGGKVASNVVIRANHFRNTSSTVGDRCVLVEAGVRNVRLYDNEAWNLDDADSVAFVCTAGSQVFAHGNRIDGHSFVPSGISHFYSGLSLTNISGVSSNLAGLAINDAFFYNGVAWTNHPIATLTNAVARDGWTTLSSPTYSATMYINVSNATYQTITLTGDVTVGTTNRSATVPRSTGAFFTASGGDRVVTFSAALTNRVWGTNFATFTIPSGREAYIYFLSLGANESDVRVSYEVN